MSKEENPGYHIRVIEKGVLGEFSKIREEYLECMDAFEQFCVIMALIEMSDLLGAMRWYYGEDVMEKLIDIAREVAEQEDSKIVYPSFQDAFKELETMPDHEPHIVVFIRSIIGYLGEVNMSIHDLKTMNDITRRAFDNGRR
jgi:hypothetical protein